MKINTIGIAHSPRKAKKVKVLCGHCLKESYIHGNRFSLNCPKCGRLGNLLAVK